MKHKTYPQYFFIFTLSLGLLACAQHTYQADAEREPAAAREAPTVPPQEGLEAQCREGLEQAPKEIFLKYLAYWVSYSPTYRIPNWVSHELYKESLEKSCAKRSNKFVADPRLDSEFKLKPVGPKDYTHTGFDRGHMAPSADFAWSQKVNNESFTMTNVTPQTPNLNQQAWSFLENRIRRWACGHGHLKIYTGPVIQPNIQRLNNCVSVPAEFFKVVLSDQAGQHKAIGFIYQQSDKADVWKERALSVKEVEARTGLQFFTEFPDEVAEKFKASFETESWEKLEQNCMSCPRPDVKDLDN